MSKGRAHGRCLPGPEEAVVRCGSAPGRRDSADDNTAREWRRGKLGLQRFYDRLEGNAA